MGQKMSLKEQIRKNQRTLRKAIRDIDRERKGMEREQQKMCVYVFLIVTTVTFPPLRVFTIYQTIIVIARPTPLTGFLVFFFLIIAMLMPIFLLKCFLLHMG